MAATNKTIKNKHDEYPDDIFKDTRMSFGDHIEELRVRMFKAIKWLIFFLVIGFVLDGIGDATKNPNIGVGKPMLKVITEPVESQVRDFYYRRIQKSAALKLGVQPEVDKAEKLEAQRVLEKVDMAKGNVDDLSPDELAVYKKTPQAIQKKLEAANNSLTALTGEEIAILRLTPMKMPVILPTAPIAEALGLPPGQVKVKEIQLDAMVVPARFTHFTNMGEGLLENRQYLSTLSVQEGFVVYFKVSILCSLVLASPFLLFQFWAFVGAGLYPHEKKHVYTMFAPSVVLFLAGVSLCQFVVLPGAVKALLGFNEWLGLDPEIRLREWLGLALILPVVFGLSFQTPLVMVFLNRIGVFTAQDYLAKWRHALMVLAVFSALLTPTPDAITMLYLFTPMFGLYLVGIVVCYYFPGIPEEAEEAEAAEEVAV
ncbi:MAG: twin-arginine translocase subunit TatC [Planctomycetaceae bacterium]|nr:twin-arginine translocase subunit TatC [Planctomycetaceae bacterium]